MYGAHISHYSAPHAWAREARTDLVDGQSLARYRERFYGTLAPPESPPLTSADALRVAFAGRRRPLCVRGCRVSGSVRSTNRGGTRHGRARTGPRTATDQPTDGGGEGHGRGRQERLCRPLSPGFPL
jgi:hypothetical protein